ncbi:MAG: zinc-binding dehydrogenase [Myxococcales bacterium]|nr:zinc-binding dehydrogenase [Myxococcales bacterium]
MRAVVVNPKSPACLAFAEVAEPSPRPDQAVVAVRALSLNRGEVRMAAGKEPGTRIGWDIAGVVEAPAADGRGPARGERVVAFLPNADGWAERVAVETSLLARIPASISDEVAAALPVAGLTALRGLDKGGRLVGRRVAITGATGGVGGFAVQLARAMGAEVVAQVRREAQIEGVRALGADHVVVGDGSASFAGHAPYALALDGLGGEMIGGLVAMLDRHGVAVTYGGTASFTTTFGVYSLTRTASLYGFMLHQELAEEPGGVSLARLMNLIERGLLRVEIGRRGDWSTIGEAAQALSDRGYGGKAVLSVG